MDREDAFSVEGHLEIGPSEQYFVFLDGEWLGRLLLNHFDLPEERGYTSVGRVRVTFEPLEEPEPGEPALPDRPS